LGKEVKAAWGAAEEAGGTGVVMEFAGTADAGGGVSWGAAGAVDVVAGVAADAGWVNGTTTAGFMREAGTQPGGHSISEEKGVSAAGVLAAAVFTAALGAAPAVELLFFACLGLA
jgi:hypothetical protein